MHSRVTLEALTELLNSIHAGQLVLPEFQRDYLWAEADVRSLLVTVFRGWPAGSLLLMEGDPEPFAVRRFEGGPEPGARPTYVVLDGQQRLTALYHAFRDAGPDVYALNLRRIPELARALADPSESTEIEWDPEDVEQSLDVYPRTVWDESFGSIARQADEFLLPTSVLLSPAQFYSWRDEVAGARLLPTPEVLSARLTELYTQMLGGVQSYQFPCVVLAAGTEPNAISRIFERLNRTGLTLGAFDLVVARTYSVSWNLRSEFEQTRAEHRLVDQFLGDDGVPILQVLALREKKDVRQSAVLDLDAKLIRGGWHESAAALQAALEFLVAECGVRSPDWLPYRSQLLVLGTLSLELDLREHTAALRRWFWRTSFGVAFDVAANTRVVSEHDVLVARLVGGLGDLPDPAEAVDANTIWYATRRRHSAVWRAFICALASRDVTDPTGAALHIGRDVDGLGHTSLITRVFPRAATAAQEEPLHLRVLNVLMTARETEKRRRTLSWQSILASAPAEVVDRALATQFLPARDQFIQLSVEPLGLMEYRLQALSQWLGQEGLDVEGNISVDS